MNRFKFSAAFGAAYHTALFLLTLSGGWLVSKVLDCAMSGGHAGRYIIFLTLVFLIGLPVIFILKRRLGEIMRREKQDFREELYGDIIGRRIDVSDKGELDVRLSNDLDAVARYYQEALPLAVEGIGIAVGSVLMMFNVSFALGTVLCLMSLTQLLPTIVYEKWAKEIYEQTDYAEERYDSLLIEGAEGLSTLKSFMQENRFMQKLEKVSEGMVSAGIRAEKTGTVETVIFSFVDGLLRYGSYLIIGAFVLNGWISTSDTPILIVLGGYLFSSVGSLLDVFQKRFEYSAAKSHLKKTGPTAIKSPEIALLKVENVSKSFGEKQVLKDVSFEVMPHERVLLSGANGSGKSTLLNISLGFLMPDSGSVSVNPKKISYSLQTEGELTLTGFDIINDLKTAGSVDVEKMMELLHGFMITGDTLNMPLNEWSMGQRKKFYLSAAFSKPAGLIVLDEPTNHLDLPALEYLYSLINCYHGAVLAVSHNIRKNMPVKWDRIINLEEKP